MGGLGHLEHITVESVASFWFYWMGPGAAMKLAEPLGLYSAQIDGPPIARYAALIDALAGNPTLAPMIEAKIAMMADRARAFFNPSPCTNPPVHGMAFESSNVIGH